MTRDFQPGYWLQSRGDFQRDTIDPSLSWLRWLHGDKILRRAIFNTATGYNAAGTSSGIPSVPRSLGYGGYMATRFWDARFSTRLLATTPRGFRPGYQSQPGASLDCRKEDRRTRPFDLEPSNLIHYLQDMGPKIVGHVLIFMMRANRVT